MDGRAGGSLAACRWPASAPKNLPERNERATLQTGTTAVQAENRYFSSLEKRKSVRHPLKENPGSVTPAPLPSYSIRDDSRVARELAVRAPKIWYSERESSPSLCLPRVTILCSASAPCARTSCAPRSRCWD